MMPTAERLMLVVPEILMLSGAVLVSVMGLSRAAALRAAVPFVSIATLVAAIVAVAIVHTPERAEAAGLPIPMLGLYGRSLIAAIGIGLVAVSIGSIDVSKGPSRRGSRRSIRSA
jgi:hypothetical protein